MTQADPSPMPRSLVLAIIGASIFVVITVNYFIYWARYAFARDFPDATKETIPTISGALTEPSIGDPFALWISISAAVLFCCVVAMVYLWWQWFSTSGLRILGAVILPVQAVSCVGMVILSNYTFPDHRDAHMAGSYMFFIAQTLVILLCLFLARRVAHHPDFPALVARKHVSARANQLRVTLGAVILVMVLVYLCLFIGKDFVSPDLKRMVLVAYVNLESFCITAYLLFLALYQIDLWGYFRRGAD